MLLVVPLGCSPSGLGPVFSSSFLGGRVGGDIPVISFLGLLTGRAWVEGG